MNETGYRKRTANFSTLEIQILLDLVKKYKHIIECKQSDKILWNKKNQVWVEIAELFNSFSGKIYRDAGVLKKKYENLKKVMKRKFAAQQYALEGTGRGFNVSSITKIDEEVKALIEMQAVGQESDNDCNVAPGSHIENINKGIDKRDDLDSDWTKRVIFIENENSIDFKDENESSSLPSTSEKSEVTAQMMGVAVDKWERLAVTKSELVQLKKDILQKEHELKVKHAIEQHEVVMQKLKLEVELLKRKL